MLTDPLIFLYICLNYKHTSQFVYFTSKAKKETFIEGNGWNRLEKEREGKEEEWEAEDEERRKRKIRYLRWLIT